DSALMHQGLAKGSACGGIPESGRPVLTSGDDQATIRTKGDAPNRPLMRSKFPQILTLCDIPQPRAAVIASGEDEIGILRMEGHGTDGAWMLKYGGEQVPRGHVPEPGLPVPTAGEDGLAIRAKGDGQDRRGMAEWLPQGFSRGYFPEPGGLIITSHQEHP